VGEIARLIAELLVVAEEALVQNECLRTAEQAEFQRILEEGLQEMRAEFLERRKGLSLDA
jgi:hypothetical protein